MGPDPTSEGGPRRRALITGASAGIGEAFARRLARDAYDLVLVARRKERLEVLAHELSERHGGRAEVQTADLATPEGLAAVAAGVAESPPDLLVNNAGFGTVGPLAQQDPEREAREILLNVLAVHQLTRAALPGILARGRGAIINVSSLAGEMAAPYSATYAATKAFVTRLSEALHEEVKESGVRVQALLPGFTRTEFQQEAGVDVDSVPRLAWMEPEQVVEASLQALERGDALCIPGAGNKLLGMLQALAPRWMGRRLIGSMQKRRLVE